MATCVSIVGAVGGLDAPIVLELQHFILDSHAVLARDARYMLILLEVGLDICLKELLGVHVTHIRAVRLW